MLDKRKKGCYYKQAFASGENEKRTGVRKKFLTSAAKSAKIQNRASPVRQEQSTSECKKVLDKRELKCYDKAPRVRAGRSSDRACTL